MRTALVRAGVGAVWIATIAAAILLRPAPDQREIRFSIPTPDTPRPQMIAVSPDGRLVAYVGLSADGKSPVLWIRPLAATIAQPIAGTDGANFPFWSPDSRFVGFGVTGKLKKVDVTGGPPQNVADISGFAGGTWNRDDIIVFSDGTKLKRVAAVGGTASDLTVSDNNAARRIYPAFLPDGRHFLYSTFDGDAGKRGIYAGSLAGGTSSLVVQAESKPVYAGAGLLLFQREGTVFAQPFDAGNLRLTGEPRRVADDVAFNSLSGFGAFAASDNGVLVFRGGVAAMLMNELRWLGRDGKLLGKAGEPGAYRQIALSPDDKRVAIERRDSKTTKYDVWTLELSSDIQTRLTFDSASALGPIWAPDSRTVVFHSTRKGPINFYQKTIGSSNEAVVLESAESPKYTEDVSGDGKFFLYHRDAPVGLYALPRTGDRKPITLVESQFSIDEARFSPDGKWIAYGSTESGEWEVYVAAFPAFDHRQRVSSHGGGQVRWRADGKELYYLSPDGKVMAVAARAGSPLEFIVPKELFQSPIARPSMNIDQWGVSRDGQRFLFIAPMQTQAATIDPITVVVNWQRGLKK
jgi:Tol biopolymer transport system component